MLDQLSDRKPSSKYYAQLQKILLDMTGVEFKQVMCKDKVKYLFSYELQYRIGRRIKGHYDKYAKYDIELQYQFNEYTAAILKVRLQKLVSTRPRYCGDLKVLIARIDNYPVHRQYLDIAQATCVNILDATEFNPYSIGETDSDWINYESKIDLI
jgi:hypothetical protein